MSTPSFIKYLGLIYLFFLSQYSYSQSAKTLDSIRIELERIDDLDNRFRNTLDSLENLYGANSTQVLSHWQKINFQDSINRKATLNILDKFGWLSSSQISKKANKAYFIVLQHSPLDIQLRYLPILKDAVKKHNAQPQFYAYLSDRILMQQRKFQEYGTQVTGDSNGKLKLYPIRNEPSVNKRRKQLGLNNIEEYAINFNISYKVSDKDTLKHKVIINGYISDETGKALKGVKIYSKEILLGQTDGDGVFTIIGKRSILKSHLRFQDKSKKGNLRIVDNGEDIFDISYTFK